jgi:signal transduction histidine kinase
MPKGGVLNLDTHVNNDPLIFVDRRKGGSSRKIPGPWIEIAVKDTGVGIPKEHLSRVFEPFFTTKEIGKGTGLGLAVSMGIIQKHGGDLRVESLGANKGACFIIHLPVKRMQSHDIQSSTPGIAA